MARAARARRPARVGLRIGVIRRAGHRRVVTKVHGRRLHPHKGYHGPRRPYHWSAAARARRRGKPHPHKGWHGHRAKHHISAEALARRVGRKHPHKGHPVSAATRAKISQALTGRHRRR